MSQKRKVEMQISINWLRANNQSHVSFFLYFCFFFFFVFFFPFFFSFLFFLPFLRPLHLCHLLLHQNLLMLSPIKRMNLFSKKVKTTSDEHIDTFWNLHLHQQTNHHHHHHHHHHESSLHLRLNRSPGFPSCCWSRAAERDEATLLPELPLHCSLLTHGPEKKEIKKTNIKF